MLRARPLPQGSALALAPDVEVLPPPAPPAPPAPAPAARGPRLPRGLPSRLRVRLPRGLAYSLLVYLLSRVVVAVAVARYLAADPSRSIAAAAEHRDGGWYLRIATQGYGSSLRTQVTDVTDLAHSYSDWAFFPGYPLLTRAFSELTRLPPLTSLLVVAGVCGLLAVWATYALGDAYGGTRVGQGAALLIALWPGSAAFSFPYSESLFVAGAAASLACLRTKRWVLAGLAGAVAAGTRPTGLALVAAGVAVAGVQVWRSRAWRSLLAPALTLLGPAAFVAFAWLRTGDPLAWRHAENLWDQQLDLGTGLVRQAWPLLADPSAALATERGTTDLVSALVQVGGLAGLLAMLVALLVRWRHPSVAMLAYAAVVVAMIVGYSAVGPRPRQVLALVPGFVWLAAVLPRWATVALGALLGAGLFAVTSLWLWAVIP